MRWMGHAGSFGLGRLVRGRMAEFLFEIGLEEVPARMIAAGTGKN